jgi:hypothetical protein
MVSCYCIQKLVSGSEIQKGGQATIGNFPAKTYPNLSDVWLHSPWYVSFLFQSLLTPSSFIAIVAIAVFAATIAHTVVAVPNRT